MRPSYEEQETVIRIGRTEDTAEICTSDTRYMTKFDKLVENSDEWEFVRQETCEGDVVEKFYKCPANFISFRGKQRTGQTGRTLSEEQKQKMKDARMAKYA